jgi:hypothetical protein
MTRWRSIHRWVRQRLGFEIDAVGLWVRALKVSFYVVDRLVHLLGRGTCDKAHPHVHEQIVRTHVHGKDVAGALDRRIRLHAPP